MITPLNESEQQSLRRWVKKIDNDTWEIKENKHSTRRLYVAFLLFVMLITLPISPSGREIAHDAISMSFYPKKVFEESYENYGGYRG